MVADTDDESSNHPSLVDIENDVYLTEHLAKHISATRHHLTGTPEHPEPPYAPSFHPPTGYWTPTEKALFFRALSAHSRLRPDLIAASIGTKSAVDVAIYISLLREGATRHPAAHQVSAELVALEDQQAAHICVAEPMHAKEVESKARAETLRLVKNGMRVPRGEGRKGCERDREGQLARKEEFERLRAEREIEWAREDALARLDAGALQVLDRILREEGKSSTMPHPVGSSSLAGELHATAPPQSPPPATPTLNDNEDDAGAIPPNLSPASRRLISKRLYMRRKRAEASGGTAQLDPARLKPGRKVSATSKYKLPKPHADGHGAGDSDSEDPNPKQWLYLRLDASRPENVAESIAKETIETLHTLVVQFTRGLVRRAITLREVDFALRAHTKVGVLEIGSCARFMCVGRWNFVESEDEDEDVPLAVLARMRMAKAIASDEDEDEDANTSVGESEQQEQQAGPSKDSQAHDAAWECWPSSHRAIYSPLVYAPDLIKPAHPFGVYAPGTMPEELGHSAPAYLCHVTHQDTDDEEREEDDDLMPTETDEEALEVELKAEERLDAADARAAAAYEAGVWRELRSASTSAHKDVGTSLRRSRKRRRSGNGEEVEVGGDVSPTAAIAYPEAEEERTTCWWAGMMRKRIWRCFGARR
ncbi:hypothetical protein BGY98DRAFT_1104190 [Russula aff. rugulosa BPL654]|nr:hypothetical protein BGY98DRAFT_1104190 [Russula aff. rugulosa BPL654]